MKVSGTATITSGTYLGKIIVTGNLTITGGTYAQDVSQWLAPGYCMTYNEKDGTYSLSDKVWEMHLVDANGEAQVSKLNLQQEICKPAQITPLKNKAISVLNSDYLVLSYIYHNHM